MANGPESQDRKQRAALYIDGFNLYHPIRRLGSQSAHLKWANLWRLGENLINHSTQLLVKVVFCTAVPSVRQDPGKRERHERFNDAQRACGVTIVPGHYVPEPIEEHGIATGNTKWTEKQTDINVSLELLFDGIDNVYDVAFLLSADTDQIATARVFADRLLPLGKRLVGVGTPDRDAPIGYAKYGVKSVKLKAFDIERCVIIDEVRLDGRLIMRPPEYNPPSGWVHPDNRPRRAPKPPKRSAWSKGYKG